MMCARPAARRSSTCSRGMKASWPVVMAARQPAGLAARGSATICWASAQRAALTAMVELQPPWRRRSAANHDCRAPQAKPTAPTLSKKASRAKSYEPGLAGGGGGLTIARTRIACPWPRQLHHRAAGSPASGSASAPGDQSPTRDRREQQPLAAHAGTGRRPPPRPPPPAAARRPGPPAPSPRSVRSLATANAERRRRSAPSIMRRWRATRSSAGRRASRRRREARRHATHGLGFAQTARNRPPQPQPRAPRASRASSDPPAPRPDRPARRAAWRAGAQPPLPAALRPLPHST